MNTLPETIAVAKGATVPRLLYKLDEVAAMLGVDRRTVERQRSAGNFPPPDKKIGKSPFWRRETLDRWIGGEVVR